MAYKVIISGGGTGGHIFPAIAIANEIKRLHPDTTFLFVGANGKMEMEKVPNAGYEIIGLNITGIKRSLSLSNLKFPFRLIGSLAKAKKIIKDFNPNVVVGVGGYASGPVLRMATWMKVPTLIQEQNSFAGVTNRWVANAVSKVCVAYDNMDRFFPKDRIVITGNPVRSEVVAIDGKREKALSQFGLEQNKPILLIIGGSLGARSVNLAMKEGVSRVLEAGIQVLWQTGKLFKDETAELERSVNSPSLRMTEFIFEMDLAYAVADVVVSRAGAIAVSELSIVGKPTILVPFPFAAEDHQTQNALSLVNTGAAIMIPDKEVSQNLVDQALDLLGDDERKSTLSANIVKHGHPNAANQIACEVISLAS